MGRARPRPTTALCCQCGHALAIDIGAERRRDNTGPFFGEASHGTYDLSFIVQQSGEPLAPPRCILLLDCSICDERTRHAYLRDDVDRDMFEEELMRQWDGWNVVTPSNDDQPS